MNLLEYAQYVIMLTTSIKYRIDVKFTTTSSFQMTANWISTILPVIWIMTSFERFGTSPPMFVAHSTIRKSAKDCQMDGILTSAFTRASADTSTVSNNSSTIGRRSRTTKSKTWTRGSANPNGGSSYETKKETKAVVEVQEVDQETIGNHLHRPQTDCSIRTVTNTIGKEVYQEQFEFSFHGW